MNKHVLFALLVLALQPYFANAQDTKIDSLRNLLLTERIDTSRVLLLTQLSRAYYVSKPDTALQLAQEALALSRKANFT